MAKLPSVPGDTGLVESRDNHQRSLHRGAVNVLHKTLHSGEQLRGGNRAVRDRGAALIGDGDKGDAGVDSRYDAIFIYGGNIGIACTIGCTKILEY